MIRKSGHQRYGRRLTGSRLGKVRDGLAARIVCMSENSEETTTLRTGSTLEIVGTRESEELSKYAKNNMRRVLFYTVHKHLTSINYSAPILAFHHLVNTPNLHLFLIPYPKPQNPNHVDINSYF